MLRGGFGHKLTTDGLQAGEVMDFTSLWKDNGSRIVLVVADGLGGFRNAAHDTELVEANTPNLDALAAEGSTGLVDPLSHGVTVGSGPGHLALFGYNPQEYDLGRGVLSALGVGFDLQPGDVAARGNLATLDDDGNVADRRAGRLADEDAQKLVERLSEEVQVEGVEVFFRHIAEHRSLWWFVVKGSTGDWPIPIRSKPVSRRRNLKHCTTMPAALSRL
jgi:2,3-bisphosphoglycerate-independent phosphoglycerate mutase